MTTLTADNKGIIIPCTQCGKKNRIAYELIGKVGHCGNCKTTLQPPSAPIEIAQESQFDRMISASKLPIVVDFWAPWCGPCRMVAPELEKVARNSGGKFVIAKVNTEALPSLGQRYQIRSIPTLGVYINGKEVQRTTGAQPASAIQAFILESLS